MSSASVDPPVNLCLRGSSDDTEPLLSAGGRAEGSLPPLARHLIEEQAARGLGADA